MSKKLNDYSGLSREKLMDKIQSLERHVTQLQNVISKGKGEENTRKRKGARPFDFNKYNTRHVALKFLYLGWDYQGYAVQEDTDKTIEHELFDALMKTKLIESRQTSNYHRCGRTDKGVSAFSQVISIDLRSNLLTGVGVKEKEGGTAHTRPGDKIKEIDYTFILNKVLPKEIRVIAWAPVDPGFSARFSCTRRTYKYVFPKGDLDIEIMQVAAQKLVGEHDFRNFCKMDVGNGVVKYTRQILAVSIKFISDGKNGYDFCELTIEGNAFLWHQIRCIVTILFLIGQRKEPPEIIDELFDITRHPRRPQYTMASELPLVLFDSEFQDLEWNYDQGDSMKQTIAHLQALWTTESTRATIIKRMLDSLESTKVSTGDNTSCAACVSVQSQAESVIPGHKSRVYIPLLNRKTCCSLEEKLDNFAKRRKVTDTADNEMPLKQDSDDAVDLSSASSAAKEMDLGVSPSVSTGNS